MAEWTLNTDSAKNADSGGNFITQSGVYRGKFTSAIDGVTPNGACYIRFSFESNEGKKANYLNVYYTTRTGETTFGQNQINALMGLFDIKTMKPVQRNDEMALPELEGKPIAVALQRDEFIKLDGKLGWKMNILHFFDSKTGQTYGEKIEQVSPKRIKEEIKDKLVAPDALQASIQAPESTIAKVDEDEVLPWLT